MPDSSVDAAAKGRWVDSGVAEERGLDLRDQLWQGATVPTHAWHVGGERNLL
jgi:hypothetical protein